MASRGIVSGYRDREGTPTGKFGPRDNVTIEQLAKMAVGAAGIDEFHCGERLKNTGAAGRWYQLDVPPMMAQVPIEMLLLL